MLDDFLIIHRSVLPEVFEKVMRVKEGLEDGRFIQISDAIKTVGISRSAFYKYKDHVFVSKAVTLQKKALISFVLSHKLGLLSSVLSVLSKYDCSVLTINQNIPIQKKASVFVSLDITNVNIDMQHLLIEIEKVQGVNKVVLLSVE
ncbi:MAG: ACT domain-containing protein [Breznakia sp.]